MSLLSDPSPPSRRERGVTIPGTPARQFVSSKGTFLAPPLSLTRHGTQLRDFGLTESDLSNSDTTEGAGTPVTLSGAPPVGARSGLGAGRLWAMALNGMRRDTGALKGSSTPSLSSATSATAVTAPTTTKGQTPAVTVTIPTEAASSSSVLSPKQRLQQKLGQLRTAKTVVAALSDGIPRGSLAAGHDGTGKPDHIPLDVRASLQLQRRQRPKELKFEPGLVYIVLLYVSLSGNPRSWRSRDVSI